MIDLNKKSDIETYDYSKVPVILDWLQGVVPTVEVSSVLGIFARYGFSVDHLRNRHRNYLNYSTSLQYLPQICNDGMIIIAYNPIDEHNYLVKAHPDTVEDIIRGTFVNEYGDFPSLQLDGEDESLSLLAEDNSHNPHVFIALSGLALKFISSNFDIHQFCLDLMSLGFKPSRIDLACDFIGDEYQGIIYDGMDAFSNPFLLDSDSPTFMTGLQRFDRSGAPKVGMIQTFVNYYPENIYTTSFSFGSHSKNLSGMLRFYDKFYEQKYKQGNDVDVKDNLWYRLEVETHRQRAIIAFMALCHSGVASALADSLHFFFRPIFKDKKDLYRCTPVPTWDSFLKHLYTRQNDYFVSFEEPVIATPSRYPTYVSNSLKCMASYFSLMSYACKSDDDLLLDDLMTRLDEGVQRAMDDDCLFDVSDNFNSFYIVFRKFLREYRKNIIEGSKIKS